MPSTDSYMEQAALRLLDIGGGESSPVAACSYAHDFGELPGDYCLRADPVHLQVDTHGLVVLDCATLALAPEDSRKVATAITQHLSQDGWTLRYGDRCRWYLLGEAQDLTGPAICQVRGLHTSVSLLAGKDAPQWTSRLNELQMLMAADGFNPRRQPDQRNSVNSVWLWGGGTPAVGKPDFDGVVSENPAVLGAAAVSKLEHVVADDAAALLGRVEKGTSSWLVTLEHCRDAAAYADCETWNQAMSQLEENWFAPLLSALSARRIDSIQLSAFNGFTYHLEGTDRWKFWRKTGDYRALAGFRQESATRT